MYGQPKFLKPNSEKIHLKQRAAPIRLRNRDPGEYKGLQGSFRELKQQKNGSRDEKVDNFTHYRQVLICCKIFVFPRVWLR